MTGENLIQQKAEQIVAGNVRAASRLIRAVEDRLPESRDMIRQLFPYTGKAHIVGVTGSPGAGKSTLIDGLIEAFRNKGKTVGILAVDPTSPFSGGAVLGDRIRMSRHTEDPGVFIRSLATRGALGGLSQAAGDAIHVMDAMGKDIIIVETAGTGQQEVEIINHSHTVIVVVVPGMGDEIQAIKAGIMEIADIFVINKAGRDGTEKLHKELSGMVRMAVKNEDEWVPPVKQVSDNSKPEAHHEDIARLAGRIISHYEYLAESGELDRRIHRRSHSEMREALLSVIFGPLMDDLISSGEYEMILEKIRRRESDSYSMAEAIAARTLVRTK